MAVDISPEQYALVPSYMGGGGGGKRIHPLPFADPSTSATEIHGPVQGSGRLRQRGLELPNGALEEEAGAAAACKERGWRRLGRRRCISATAVLKIIKHCEEFAPALFTGQLLGLDVGSVLEVTNCFPFPIREEDDEADVDGANYQTEMMRCLREVNVDNNTIG